MVGNSAACTRILGLLTALQRPGKSTLSAPRSSIWNRAFTIQSTLGNRRNAVSVLVQRIHVHVSVHPLSPSSSLIDSSSSDTLSTDDRFVVRRLLEPGFVSDDLKGKQGAASRGVDVAVLIETIITALSVIYIVGLGDTLLKCLLFNVSPKSILGNGSGADEKLTILVMFAWIFWSILYASSFLFFPKKKSAKTTKRYSSRRKFIVYALDVCVTYLVGYYTCHWRQKLFGDGASFFNCDNVKYEGVRMQTWTSAPFVRHFITSPKAVKLNIEAAARHANDTGVKVLCLGALNKAESINGGGVNVVRALGRYCGDNRKVSIIHGNHLTAAAVVETTHQCFGDNARVFLTGE
uniref:Uncharacterized protein n=1 Tax=Ditylum brightwellii TaxID=49249 RepID=A0A7S4W995_9STRA